ncbi:hypothetical protein, partial [Vibrio cholerae]
MKCAKPQWRKLKAQRLKFTQNTVKRFTFVRKTA